MAKVEVLCPNGRRVPVKVTANTKILQILEEACSKQEFLPVSDYELKHGRRSLDVTLSVQHAGLPNLAKLDLVKLSKSRIESSVVIALQLADGGRVQGEFMPSDTLWTILEHFDSGSETSGMFTNSQIPNQHPVCIYMKDEVVGEYALRQTTLRSLGLTGGRIIIRHLFREVSDEVLSEIDHRIDSERQRQMRLQSAKATPDTSSSVLPTQQHYVKECLENSAPETTTDRETVELRQHETVSCNISPRCEPMQTDIQEEFSGAVTAGWNTDQWSSIFHRSVNSVVESDAFFGRTQQSQSCTSFADFKFPEETKGKHVYHNELSDVRQEELRPCDRETIIYSLDEPQPVAHPVEEDIPDEFFEVTEADVKKMWQDLQRQTQELVEQPLLTQSSRHQQLQAKMSRYKRVAIRIQFPDRFVMQGLFRTTETVFALHKFVKEHLRDSTVDFELYTTPPKVVLKDMCLNLVEANLAPMSVVHFGSSDRKDHYLSEAAMSEVSTQHAANRVLVTLMPESSSLSSLSSDNFSTNAHSRAAAATAGTSASVRPSSTSQRSTSASQASSSQSTSGSVPKWFKTGKK